MISKINKRANLLRQKLDGRCVYQGAKTGASFKLCANNYHCGVCGYYQDVVEPRMDILKEERRTLRRDSRQKEKNRCKYEGTSIGASFKICTDEHQCDRCGYYHNVIEERIDQLVDG